jgi:hypothetical protein
MGLRRYPGATPFSKRQSNIFYGRDKDIDKLLTLIQVEKKVLLYSKSGLGKTSLLEAGVLPRLPEYFVPISIRLFAYKEGAETPVERVINALKSVIGDLDKKQDTVLDQIIGDDPENKTLWYYFKKAQLLDDLPEGEGQQKIFTLVFDQFEELFSFPKKDIEDFKTQLYELTELKLPDRFAVLIAKSRRENRELFSRETIGLLHQKNEIKTIFAIRSDRLSLLNNLSDKLPDIQSTFYELLPLTYDQARQAIINPAMDKDPGFETPPFEFNKDAIDKIIHELSDGRTENIETTQLQIVCHRIEEIAAEKHTGGTVEIEVDDLPEFKNIFLNFYFGSINRLQEENRDKAKRLIEDELIRNHQRISLDEEICKEYLDEKELRNLVDSHLLRSERNTFGRFSYEVSHDTLIEPILESRKKYRDEQEKIRIERERQEELRKLREEQEIEEKERQRKIRQQRSIIKIIGISFIISVALGVFGYTKMLDAEKQERIAIENFKKFKQSQYDSNFEKGNRFKNSSPANYREAITHFRQAQEFSQTADDSSAVSMMIAESQQRLALESSHERIISKAESHLAGKEFLQAMDALNQAFELKYDSALVQQMMDDLFQLAMSIYQKDLSDYEDMKDLQLQRKTRDRIEKLNAAYKTYDR